MGESMAVEKTWIKLWAYQKERFCFPRVTDLWKTWQIQGLWSIRGRTKNNVKRAWWKKFVEK